MPKRKEPELTPAEQKKRFEELARQAGASASPKQFREVLGRIARPSAPKSDAKKAKR